MTLSYKLCLSVSSFGDQLQQNESKGSYEPTSEFVWNDNGNKFASSVKITLWVTVEWPGLRGGAIEYKTILDIHPGMFIRNRASPSGFEGLSAVSMLLFRFTPSMISHTRVHSCFCEPHENTKWACENCEVFLILHTICWPYFSTKRPTHFDECTVECAIAVHPFALLIYCAIIQGGFWHCSVGTTCMPQMMYGKPVTLHWRIYS